MCNTREKFWKIRCYQFGGKGSRKQSSPLQEKLKRNCRIKGIVIAHLADQSLWQDGNFDSLFMDFFALKKLQKFSRKNCAKICNWQLATLTFCFRLLLLRILETLCPKVLAVLSGPWYLINELIIKIELFIFLR